MDYKCRISSCLLFLHPHKEFVFPQCILILLIVKMHFHAEVKKINKKICVNKNSWDCISISGKHHFQSYDIIKTSMPNSVRVSLSRVVQSLSTILKCHLDLLQAQITLWLSLSQASQNPFRWVKGQSCDSTSNNTEGWNEHWSQTFPKCHSMQNVLIYSLLICTWITLYRESINIQYAAFWWYSMRKWLIGMWFKVH